MTKYNCRNKGISEPTLDIKKIVRKITALRRQTVKWTDILEQYNKWK
jgi:hypothetical protein